MRVVHILCLVLYMLVGVACSDTPEDEPIEDIEQTLFILQGDESLDTLMEKVLSYYTSIEYLSPTIPSTNDFPQIEEKQAQINTLLWEAYKQNRQFSIASSTLEVALGLEQEWYILCASLKPYMLIPPNERLQVEITLNLALLLLNNNQGDSSALDSLLEKQYQNAQESGNLNTIIEFQIQVRLLALFALYHLDSINQNMEHLASHKVRMSLEADLEHYRDFLPYSHYVLYSRAFKLLKDEILKHQAPMDRIFLKLLEYPKSINVSLLEGEDLYLHIGRLKRAYALFKMHDLSSPAAREIIQIARNPLKNVYDNAINAHYLYGLDYLSLSFLGDDTYTNLPLALKYLQQDFKSFQISQHYFDPNLFQNYIASLFSGAYILSERYENQVYFDEILRILKAEIEQYSDVISDDDMELYEDALFILEKTDRSKFLAIMLVESTPEDEAGYVKVPLSLSPQEIAQIKHIISKEQSAIQEDRIPCLSPLEVSFMLSLIYQAYRAQGFESVPPEMFRIRLAEVFGIARFYQNPLKQHLIDFDSFMLLGVVDKPCYVDTTLADEALEMLKRKEEVCGNNLYFEKENAFVIDNLLPSQILEQSSDGRVYYRLRLADMYLNTFLFRNDEDALQAFLDSEDKGEILGTLLAFFPDIKEYLHNRLSPQDVQKFMQGAKPKACP